MKITKQELVDMGACEPGLERFIKQTDGTEEAVEVSSLVGGLNTYHDLMWLAGKTLNEDRILRLACDCALLSIDLIKDYTDNFDEIKEWLINPFECNTKSLNTYQIRVTSFDDKVCSAASAACGAVYTARAISAARSARSAERTAERTARFGAYTAAASSAVRAAALASAAHIAEVSWLGADSVTCTVSAIESGEERVNALLKQMFDEVE